MYKFCRRKTWSSSHYRAGYKLFRITRKVTETHTPVVASNVSPLEDTLGAGEPLRQAVRHLEDSIAGTHRVVGPTPVRQSEHKTKSFSEPVLRILIRDPD
jgi:hypothetical protein